MLRTFSPYLLSDLPCMRGSNSQQDGGCLASARITVFTGSGLSFPKSEASQELSSSGEGSSCLLCAGE